MKWMSPSQRSRVGEMAGVSLEISRSFEFLCGSRYSLGWSCGQISKQVNSAIICWAGVGTGPGVPSWLVYGVDSADRRPSRKKAVRKEEWVGWWKARSRNASRKDWEILGALDGESEVTDRGYGETIEAASDIDSPRVGRKSAELAVDQPLEYSRVQDFVPRDQIPDGAIQVKRTFGNDIGAGYSGIDREVRRQTVGSREWVQLAAEDGDYERLTNSEAGKVNLGKAYSWKRAAGARREQNNYLVDRTRGVGSDEENSETVTRGVKSSFIRDAANDQSGRESFRRILLAQGQESARVNREIGAESLGPPLRDRENAGSDERELRSRSSVVGGARRSTGATLERNFQRSKVDEPTDEGLWQESSQRSVVLGSRFLNRDNSGVAVRKASNRRRGLPDDNDVDQVVPESEDNATDRRFRQSFAKDIEKVLARGTMYAKQVISWATARNLGFVTQLWVDMRSLRVVALEVRPNLLFGNLEGILLESLSKVGDVILVRDETVILEELDLVDCSDLVGSDLLTENGFYLGKVRDYDFSFEDGAVLSLEFDIFGVPLIPSTVISTYSLTADEVIEAQEDILLVRSGAEKRVRKLTKGLFSRSNQLSSRMLSNLEDTRKRAPKVVSSRSVYNKEAKVQCSSRLMDQPSKGFHSVIGNDYFSELSSSGRQKVSRQGHYSNDRKPIINELSAANNFESNQAQAPLTDNVSRGNQDSTSQDIYESESIPLFSGEMVVKNASEQPDIGSSQPQDTLKPRDCNGRGFPMSYGTFSWRVQNGL